MQVNGLDHINIVAADVDRTVRFFETVLGLQAKPVPTMPTAFKGRWIYDRHHHPIVHVQPHDPQRHGVLDDGERATTGAIDHVALRCEDFDGMVRRCMELGLPYKILEHKSIGLRQIFVTDPNNILFELNFSGD